MPFKVLDQLTDKGAKDKPNDDWIGAHGEIAVVADGATGLADHRLLQAGESDAQWLARFAVERLMSAKPDQPVRDLVLEINNEARLQVDKAHDLDQIPRYAWPTASFIMVRDQQGMIEVSGLGDCIAYVEMQDGYVERFSALPYNRTAEKKSAARDLARSVNASSGIRSPEVVAALREKRNWSNTARSGVWTIGLVPEASEQVFTIAIPASEIRSILLMSDGFSALCEAYQWCSQSELIAKAKTSGLMQLNTEIRRVERVVDPQAERFPRYKQSDDSSAILLDWLN